MAELWQTIATCIVHSSNACNLLLLSFFALLLTSFGCHLAGETLCNLAK